MDTKPTTCASMGLCNTLVLLGEVTLLGNQGGTSIVKVYSNRKENTRVLFPRTSFVHILIESCYTCIVSLPSQRIVEKRYNFNLVNCI